MNKLFTKKLILFFVLVSILAIASGCIKKETSEPVSEKQEPVETPVVVETEVPPVQSGPTGTTTEEIDTSEWLVYRNKKLGFEIKYPYFWILSESSNEDFEKYGRVAQFQTPDTDELIKAKKLHPSESYNLVIQYWPNMNNEYARNGSSIEQREYNDLEDFFSDTKFITKHSIGEIMVDNHKAYEVIIGGYGNNYGIMIEKNGIYELSFDRIWDKLKLGEIEKKVIASFKFIE